MRRVGEVVESEPLNIDNLWDIFVNQVQVDAPESVVRTTCTKLVEAGIDQEYQLVLAPPEFLKDILPPPEIIKHYLAAMHVQKTLQEWRRPAAPRPRARLHWSGWRMRCGVLGLVLRMSLIRRWNSRASTALDPLLTTGCTLRATTFHQMKL